MNTSEMIKSLQAQGYRVRKPINREYWISFFNDGSHRIHTERPDFADNPNCIEVIHLVEKQMRKRRKKHEKQQETEVAAT